jgi:hypothetical protein
MSLRCIEISNRVANCFSRFIASLSRCCLVGAAFFEGLVMAQGELGKIRPLLFTGVACRIPLRSVQPIAYIMQNLPDIHQLVGS